MGLAMHEDPQFTKMTRAPDYYGCHFDLPAPFRKELLIFLFIGRVQPVKRVPHMAGYIENHAWKHRRLPNCEPQTELHRYLER